MTTRAADRCPLTTAIIEQLSRRLEAVARPDGEAVHVLDMPSNPVAVGVSRGSGHRIAAAHGLPGVAVLVTVSPLVDALLREYRPETIENTFFREGLGAIAAGAFEQIAAHELGHALASPRDPEGPIDAGELANLQSLTASGPANLIPPAESHGPAWAAATAILYRRCMGSLPDCAYDWHRNAVAEFARYGLDYPAVAALVANVPGDAPIRPIVADAGFIGRIEAATPSVEDRRAIIASRNTRPADVPPARDPAAAAA